MKLLLIFALLISCWLSLFAFSSLDLGFWDPIRAIFYPDPIKNSIIFDLRLPRMLQAIITGASLACAGTLMQGMTQNSLASPSLFGINAGAALGMALVTAVFPGAYIATTSACLMGSASAWGLVMLLGTQVAKNNLVLAGIAVSALCAAATKASVIMAEDQAVSVMSWLAGSFVNTSWETVLLSYPILGISIISSICIASKINLFSVGQESLVALGVNLSLLRGTVSILVLILVSVSISTVGAIAFVGLVVPNIGKMLVGFDNRKLLPIVILMGATLTVIADILSRAVAFPTETPAGALLAIIGAPYFIYISLNKNAKT